MATYRDKEKLFKADETGGWGVPGLVQEAALKQLETVRLGGASYDLSHSDPGLFIH